MINCEIQIKIKCHQCETSFDPIKSNIYCSKCTIEQGEWISIKDRLPTERIFDSVFIATISSRYKNKKFVYPLHYIDSQWFNMVNEELLDRDYEVTHWMPLPLPPDDK